jgi:SPP1 gp7 family putative phage head morphogenesis protein
MSAGCCSSLTFNAALLIRADPTRTTTTQRQFLTAILKRFQNLKDVIKDFLVTRDALGLVTPKKQKLIFHASSGASQNQYAFLTDDGKQKAFRRWLQEQIDAKILTADPGTNPNEPWTTKFVESAYKIGMRNAFLSTKQSLSPSDPDYLSQTSEQFIRESFFQPERLSKVQLLATRTFEDMDGLGNQVKSSLNKLLAQAMADGKGAEQIAREMSREISTITRRRAMLIARTECLPGDTLVDGAVVNRAFRRWHDGDLVEIKTRNGRVFSATPNHPMLTDCGWVAAGQLNNSHNLISNKRRNPSSFSGNPNIKRGPSTIREIFDSLSAIGTHERRTGRNPDFHGDGSNSEVDTFSSDRELFFGDFSTLGKEFVKSSLPPSNLSAFRFCHFCGGLLSINKQECLCERSQFSKFFETAIDCVFADIVGKSYAFAGLPGLISFDDLFHGAIDSMYSLVRNPSSLPSQLLRFGVRSHFSGSSDHVLNPGKVSPFLLRNVPSREAGDVEFDQVVSVTLRKFSGHIYNLETPVGYFTINGGLYTGNTIHAHAEGQLDSFEDLGVRELGITAEWSTAGDERVCPRCSALEGHIYTVEEARGMIPQHPGCRCSWIPRTNTKTDKQKAEEAKK